MQLLLAIFLILVLERTGSCNYLNTSSSLVSSSTTLKPEVSVSFGDAYDISCSDGACRANKSSILYDEWLVAKKQPIFYPVMNQLVHMEVPENLVGDYQFGVEVMHIAGYTQDSHSKEITEKYYRHALNSTMELYKTEGTYYNHPYSQIFVCLNRNYSKPVLKCTSAINTAYELCNKEHPRIKNNIGICKIPETFKTCWSTMKLQIEKNCKFNPLPRFLTIVTKICVDMGTQRCGTYDSFYKTYNSCLPIATRKEFARIGDAEPKVLESFYTTGATFCNLFSSYLDGRFKEDYCRYFMSRYKCMKNNYQDEPLCRRKTELIIKLYEYSCLPPKEQIIEGTDPTYSAGSTVLYTRICTVILLITMWLM